MKNHYLAALISVFSGIILFKLLTSPRTGTSKDQLKTNAQADHDSSHKKPPHSTKEASASSVVNTLQSMISSIFGTKGITGIRFDPSNQNIGQAIIFNVTIGSSGIRTRRISNQKPPSRTSTNPH
ncbi:hypothetical protein [Salisediminibacterium selenitireducens]|uniref:Uncharacterized protein n=1 Tax=Bacillus selenitireducens (strain ATCC 700615 / DSM 15326 / MLS10) TaxID=439292 RepID=D6XZM0_BACIE|nr:hypothetical protein [Salisediminibacterium selenitireducens]ADH98394.1 hypothetical protein Bsel_0870 [[Bacillus] selenitireducens MLS10]